MESDPTTRQDELDQINQRVTNRACPFCGHDEWELLPVSRIYLRPSDVEDPDFRFGGTQEGTEQQESESAASNPLVALALAIATVISDVIVPFPAAAWICGNCGFLRVHV